MTNQSRPLFAVNEQIRLVCKGFPEDNGDFTIVEMDWSNDFEYFNVNEKIPEPPMWHYKLDNGIDVWYEESCLRKKYPPSSQSFSELINSLKTPAKMS